MHDEYLLTLCNAFVVPARYLKNTNDEYVTIEMDIPKCSLCGKEVVFDEKQSAFTLFEDRLVIPTYCKHCTNSDLFYIKIKQ